MAAPELVIADAPVVKYPGGVVAVRASDYMGPARATLTTAADSMSCSGTRVVDTQTVTQSLRTARVAAYEAAEDTLVIPVADLGLDSELDYVVWVSHHIVGEWDVADADTLIAGTHAHFQNVCVIGLHGHPDDPLPADFGEMTTYLCRLPHYSYMTIGSGTRLDTPGQSDILRFRAFTHEGTTVELRLDQIVFFPDNIFKSDNYEIMAGNIILNPEDGTDGGDANGEYTINTLSAGNSWEAMRNFGETPGGGDYQKATDADDAEYRQRFTAATSNRTLRDHDTDLECLAHNYGLYGTRYREEQTITEDNFSRDVDPGWGNTPEGYAWPGTTGQMRVEDDVGKFLMGFAGTAFADTSTTQGAGMRLWDQFIISGKFRLAEQPSLGVDVYENMASSPGDDFAHVMVTLFGKQIELVFKFREDADDKTWQLVHMDANGNPLTAEHTGSLAWFDHLTDWIAWKVEVKRYLTRVKVWDASGAEPGAWDYEGFMRWHIVAGANAGDHAYPYPNHTVAYAATASNTSVQLRSLHAIFTSVSEIFWDDFKIEYDPYGDTPTDMHAQVEMPEGTAVGEITVPYGAAYFVYWGYRDWTDVQPATTNIRVEYSSKVWNEIGAPEMQRAEETNYWLRAVLFNLVSMNWRSSERNPGTRRMLVGDTPVA